jgi:hypothetical protein
LSCGYAAGQLICRRAGLAICCLILKEKTKEERIAFVGL